MYRESETIIRSPFADHWERLRVKFRASFPGQKSVLRCFDTAMLDEVRTTTSQLCFSVESAGAMTLLDSEYGHFLQQLWCKITGHNVKVVILTRAVGDSDGVAAKLQKKADIEPTRTFKSVGVTMLEEEPKIPPPPPVGVLSPTISLETELFVDGELRREGHFTAALCMVYVSHRYNIKSGLLISRKKLGHLTRLRWIAVYLTRSLTSLSYKQIGKQFGKMTSKFSLDAVKSIDELRVKNVVFDAEIQGHIEYLRGRQRAVLKASSPVVFVPA